MMNTQPTLGCIRMNEGEDGILGLAGDIQEANASGQKNVPLRVQD